MAKNALSSFNEPFRSYFMSAKWNQIKTHFQKDSWFKNSPPVQSSIFDLLSTLLRFETNSLNQCNARDNDNFTPATALGAHLLCMWTQRRRCRLPITHCRNQCTRGASSVCEHRGKDKDKLNFLGNSDSLIGREIIAGTTPNVFATYHELHLHVVPGI